MSTSARLEERRAALGSSSRLGFRGKRKKKIPTSVTRASAHIFYSTTLSLLLPKLVMSLESPLPSLQSLSASLQDLRRHLHPLLQQPLENVIGKLEQGSSAGGESSSTALDGRLDSAKLQVSIAYVLLDLVWGKSNV